MRIIFVRHGEPDYQHDCLTKQGRLQAQAVAERLRNEGIEEIYTSPFGRAVETAAASADLLGLQTTTLPFMHELCWGSIDQDPIPADGHPWELADMLAEEGWDLLSSAWREHPYFAHNRVTAEVDFVAQQTDEWLYSLGYRRDGAYYRCFRPDARQKTVALFSHGGSSAAAMGHILNLPFPYACGLFHLEFTGITIIRLNRNPGVRQLPCLELANDGRHIHGHAYHRLLDM